jgi:hypothetical protein
MDRFAQAVQGVVQFLNEAVEREWRSLEERRFHSQLKGPWFDQIAGWLEEFAGHGIWHNAQERRDEVLAYARGVRDEVALLLGQIEPPCAMAVLCALPASQALGYAPDRLSESLGVEESQVKEWERAGYRQLRAAVQERTPLLAFLLAKALEQEQEDAETNAVVSQETLDSLRQEARTNPDFDLRRYISSAVELRVRQWLNTRDASDKSLEEHRVAVALVQERMKLELEGPEVE